MPAGFNGQMAPGGSAASDVLESQTMTSDTVPPCFSSPRRGPPLDLVLHALQDALHGLALQAASDEPTMEAANLSGLSCALTRAINPGALASSWAAEGDADIAGAHLARRLANPGAEDGDLRPVSTAEGRTLETAVARRLADTACSLAITGDKEDAEHARALWEASATLTGLLPPYTGDTLRAAADIVTAVNRPAMRGRIVSVTTGAEFKAGDTLVINPVVTPRILQSADEAPCGSLLRDKDGDITLRFVDGYGQHLGPTPRCHGAAAWGCETMARNVYAPIMVIAEGLTEAECRHLSGLSAADAIAWCERRDADVAEQTAAFSKGGPCASKPRPQPGDVVPWAEVEDSALYSDLGDDKDYPFLIALQGGDMWLSGPTDDDLVSMLRNGGKYGARHGSLGGHRPPGILVARDLGTDPEAWRRAMREWTANGNKPAAPIKDPRLEVPGALLDDLRTEAGEHSIDAETIVRSAVREIKRRRAAMDILTAKRAEAQETADRRMALLLQADERDSMVREYLGATDSESTVDAAKRVAKERNAAVRDLQAAGLGAANVKAATDRLLAQAYAERDAANGQRDIEAARASAAIKDRNAMFMERDAAIAEAAHVRKTSEDYVFDALKGQREAKDEAHAAIEARAQMQARLVAVERERDAAQEEAKNLRAARAPHFDHRRIVEVHDGDGSM